MDLGVRTALVAVVLNVVLSYVVAMVATPTQKKPPGGPASLDIYSQIVHMLVHHDHVKLSSSLIVGIVAYLAVEIAMRFKMTDLTRMF